MTNEAGENWPPYRSRASSTDKDDPTQTIPPDRTSAASRPFLRRRSDGTNCYASRSTVPRASRTGSFTSIPQNHRPLCGRSVPNRNSTGDRGPASATPAQQVSGEGTVTPPKSLEKTSRIVPCYDGAVRIRGDLCPASVSGVVTGPLTTSATSSKLPTRPIEAFPSAASTVTLSVA